MDRQRPLLPVGTGVSIGEVGSASISSKPILHHPSPSLPIKSISNIFMGKYCVVVTVGLCLLYE